MHYDFDKIVNRENTACVKYDLRKNYFGKADVFPMWVADMDFEAPDFIRKAVVERANHPVYGYSFRPDAYYESLMAWVSRRHDWQIEKSWILFSPGVVPALNMATLAFTEPGDGVLVQPPVYFPFFNAVKDHKRTLLENQLAYDNEKYTIDFEDFERKLNKVKMFFLSNPHNPVGRLWTQEELKRMGDLCVKHHVLIISDEIHSDLVLPGYKHTPMASVSEEIAENTVTCMAPSKTFNLAGLATSSVIVKNRKHRIKLMRLLEHLHLSNGNFFGTTASIAAYTNGEQWLSELMVYTEGNFQLLNDYLMHELPVLKLVHPEATYLAWIDFKGTGLSDGEIKRKLLEEAKLGLSPGPVFGKGGEGFQRMNLATPKANVRMALDRLKEVFG